MEPTTYPSNARDLGRGSQLQVKNRRERREGREPERRGKGAGDRRGQRGRAKGTGARWGREGEEKDGNHHHVAPR